MRICGLDRSKFGATVLVVRAIRRFTVRPVLPRAAGRPGRPRRQPALVLAPADPGRLRAPSTPSSGTRRQPRPGAAARRGRPRRGSTSWPATRTSWPAASRRSADLSATSPATAGTSARPATDAPRAIAYFSPEFGITAVLPQYSGGLGILAGDHLKAACDLGVPLIGVGLLYRHGYFKQSLSREGWQQETYPVLDPDGLPLTLLREADGTARHRRRSRCPTARTCVARIWVAQVGRVPLLLLDSDVEENPRPLPRRHRPPVRRHHRAPAAPGAAARRRRRPRPARLLADHRRARRPRSSTPTRATPASSASSGSASSPSARAARARLRHRARGLPRRHRLHHPHARSRPASTGSRASWSSSTSAATSPTPGVPVDRILALGAEDYDGRRPRRLQHGRDGLPARPARQRRLAAARPGLPRDVQRPVAGLRRGRGADRLDHQRRARPDLGGPRGLRARRRAAAPTSDGDDADALLGAGRQGRRPRDLGRSSARCAQRLVDDARDRLRRSPGGQARRSPPPSSAGSTPPSTPTCSPSASRAACRRTSGSR